MRSLLTFVLAAAVVVLLFQVHSQSAAIKALRQSTALQSPPVPSLELQEKCARQAAAEYRQEGLEASPMAEFTDHYSAKLGRCFVVTKNRTILGKVLYTHALLVDAYEGRVFGTFEWSGQAGRPDWEVAPSACTVVSASGDDRQCRSDEEWNSLVKAYMDAP